jgi:CNP1-like family
MRGTYRFFSSRIEGGRFSLPRLLLAAMLAVTIYLPAARSSGDEIKDFDFDPQYVEKWTESEIVIPAYPQDQDLIPVPLPPTATLKVYLDRRSLSRAPDRVARFSLVVESHSGTRSVFYEGLRCETRQYKTYAVGTANRTLEAVGHPRWRDIPRPEINDFRFQLYRHFVCDDHDSARAPDDLVRQLKDQL